MQSQIVVKYHTIKSTVNTPTLVLLYPSIDIQCLQGKMSFDKHISAKNQDKNISTLATALSPVVVAFRMVLKLDTFNINTLVIVPDWHVYKQGDSNGNNVKQMNRD